MAGRMTIGHMRSIGVSSSPNDELVQQLVRAGITKSSKEVLEDQGKCAGSMVG